MRIYIIYLAIFIIAYTNGVAIEDIQNRNIVLEEPDDDLLNSMHDVLISKKHDLIAIVDSKNKKVKYYDLQGRLKKSFYIDYFVSDSIVKLYPDALKTKKVAGEFVDTKSISTFIKPDSLGNIKDFYRHDIYGLNMVDDQLVIRTYIKNRMEYYKDKQSNKKNGIGSMGVLIHKDLKTHSERYILIRKDIQEKDAISYSPIILDLVYDQYSKTYLTSYFKYYVEDESMCVDSCCLMTVDKAGKILGEYTKIPNVLMELGLNKSMLSVVYCKHNQGQPIYAYQNHDHIFIGEVKSIQLQKLPFASNDIIKRIKADTSLKHIKPMEKVKLSPVIVKNIFKLSNGNILIRLLKNYNGRKYKRRNITCYQEYTMGGDLVREEKIDLSDEYGLLKQIEYIPEDNVLVEFRINEDNWNACFKKWN